MSDWNVEKRADDKGQMKSRGCPIAVVEVRVQGELFSDGRVLMTASIPSC